MNVTCPECRSIFRVDPSKVPTGGVRARCAVCGGVMPVAAPAAFVGAPGDTPIRPSAAVPGSSAAWSPPPPAAPTRPATPAHVPTAADAGASWGPGVTTGTPSWSRPAPAEQRRSDVSPPSMPRPAAGPSTPSPGMPSPGVQTPATPTPRMSAPVAPPSAPVASPSAPVAGTPWPPAPAAGSAAPAPRPSGASGRPINPFLANDPNQKAKRLARALVSDIVAYHPQLRDQGMRDGTLKQLFRDEIKKSYEEYVDQVGKEFADTTGHFQEALNEVLAGGRKMF